MANVNYFSIEFNSDAQKFVSFPFIVDGIPVEGIFCGISLRSAGDMKYNEHNQNRLSLFTDLALEPANVYGLNQIHSQSALVVDRNNPPAAPADGMVTRDRSITLSVTVADCLPVFLFDTTSGAFGIVHSGWKGTGIAVQALNLMNKHWETKPCDVAAILGPCIDSCCYKVDAERAAIFEKEFGSQCVRQTGEDFFLDLKAANIKILTDAGIQNIAVCQDCTFTDERLGSFRRQGETYTRMIAMIGVKK